MIGADRRHRRCPAAQSFGLADMWSRVVHFVLLPLATGIVTAIALRYLASAATVRSSAALVVGRGLLWRGGRHYFCCRRRRFADRSVRRGVLAGSGRDRKPLSSREGRVDMCGIAGIVNLRGKTVEPAEISRLTNLIGASRPGRRGDLVQCRPKRRPRSPAAGDHRSRRGRLSADGVCRWPLCDHLQRRDLQFPRASPRTGGAGRDLPHPVRYRSHPGRLASLAGRDAAAFQRHVGAGDLRHPNPRAVSCARSLRHQAAALCDVAGAFGFRIRAACHWCRAG